MVWGNWFGKGRKSDQELLQEMFASLDRMWRDAVRVVEGSSNIDSVDRITFRKAVYSGDQEEARRVLRRVIFPQLSEEERERIRYAGQSESWAKAEDLVSSGIVIPENAPFPMDALELAYLPTFDGNGERAREPLWFQGEGHLLTVAPTGSGKGQRFILRTLLEFEGPAIVLDPKGENYKATAWRRNLFGQVFKWAPGEPDSDCYNPLDRVKGWDDARLLAELLVIPQSKEPFWDDAARDLLTGLIFYVQRRRPPGRRNMREVCRLLALSKADLDDMIEDLQAADDERLRELGNIIQTQSEALRASIANSLRTQLAIWRSDDVMAVTSTSTPGWSVEDILVRDNITVTFAAKEGRAPGWHQRQDGGVTRGSAATVYLVVSPEKMSAMRSVMRVLLGQHLGEAIRVRKMLDDGNAEDENLPEKYLDWPMMFYLDELPQLGYMRIIEDAVAITRSYRIRLWLFTQDMAQLEEVYPKWRSLIANCRCQIYFRPNDKNTADHIADRLGKRKDIWGGEDWVASPQQLMGQEFREECVIVQDGHLIRATMYDPFYANDELRAWVKTKKAEFGDEVIRAPRPEAAPPAPEPEPEEPATADTDLAGDAEYQAELAALQARMRARKTAAPPASSTSIGREEGARTPERPVESSEPPRRPPAPPNFDE